MIWLRRAGAGLALCVIISLAACQGSTTPPVSVSPTIPPPGVDTTIVFKRVVQAHVFAESSWLLGTETPKTVGDALSQLNPTWVSGLITLTPGEELTDDEEISYNTIRTLVITAAPRCKFDFTLDPRLYPNATALVNAMQMLNARVHVDLWFLDAYDTSYVAHPDIINAAITYAHSQKQPIGGRVTSAANVPPGTDFVSVSDQGFTLDQATTKALSATQIPVLAEVGAQEGDSEAQTYNTRYTTEQRTSYIKKLAQDQASGSYSLMYPLFAPIYPAQQAFDALKDTSYVTTINEIMAQYNVVSA